ncbi:MAG: YceD family protein [Actinomycetales bacterium]
MTTLDPRSPLVLDTIELGRRPGTMREVRRVVETPPDFGTDVIGIPAGSDLELDLRLEAVMEGVLVSGMARAKAVGQCVRCLEDVAMQIEAPVQELFAYPGKADPEQDEYELDGELIDLEPVLRDAVVPALPFQPVCDPDCPGLCSECGVRLADQPDHAHDLVDPRWSALQSWTIGDDSPIPEKEN